jgi:methylated-DNA-protein-cysteine methyltransferase related protein
MSDTKAKIISIVNTVPFGKVVNFGLIGDMIGVSGQVVGFVLSGLPQAQWETLPWHRVVAKDGYISSLKLGAKGLIQKQLLLDEGVEINEDRVNMGKHLYFGDDDVGLF